MFLDKTCESEEICNSWELHLFLSCFSCEATSSFHMHASSCLSVHTPETPHTPRPRACSNPTSVHTDCTSNCVLSSPTLSSHRNYHYSFLLFSSGVSMRVRSRPGAQACALSTPAHSSRHTAQASDMHPLGESTSRPTERNTQSSDVAAVRKEERWIALPFGQDTAL